MFLGKGWTLLVLKSGVELISPEVCFEPKTVSVAVEVEVWVKGSPLGPGSSPPVPPALRARLEEVPVGREGVVFVVQTKLLPVVQTPVPRQEEV